MDTFDMETEYFRRAIEYYTDEANGWGGQTRLSDLYGCKNSYINMIIKKVKKPSYKVQNKFADILKIPRDKLLEIGKSLPEKKTKRPTVFAIEIPETMQCKSYIPPLEPMYADKILTEDILPTAAICENCHPPVTSLQDEADKKHQIVITGFKNKELAIKCNEVLVEIESLDADELQEMYENLVARRDKLIKKKGGSQAQDGAKQA